MKLSEWARAKGISYKTAWLWWKKGQLPVPARQMLSGTILVDELARKDAGAVLYARVSSVDQKADLDRQVARLVACAAEKGIRVSKVVAEAGGGLNGHRRGLISVLRSPEYGAILVEHRDRLARFGAESIRCGACGLVMDREERGADPCGPCGRRRREWTGDDKRPWTGRKTCGTAGGPGWSGKPAARQRVRPASPPGNGGCREQISMFLATV